MTPCVYLYTDGACKGNPGRGGWGFIIKHGAHEKTGYGGEACTTNNRMELTAVIEGLQTLKKPCIVELYTDSVYVARGIDTWLAGWKKNHWRNKDGVQIKNVDLWQGLDAQLSKHEVRCHWVKGHSGHAENERADQLANLGVHKA